MRFREVRAVGIRSGLRITLVVSALLGLGRAVLLYPEINDYSFMNDTISGLGSPDSDRNPRGWHWYQIGLTAALLSLGWLVLDRARVLRPLNKVLIQMGTRLYLAAILLFLLCTFIPDARELLLFGVKTAKIHNPLAVTGIIFLVPAIWIDGKILAQSGYRGWRWRLPFWVFFALISISSISFSIWHVRVMLDDQLKLWPGEGIHSVPMWEWILFCYLLVYLVWIGTRKIETP